MGNDLKDATRILLQVQLKPVQGTRFQPTGFPDLGAAEILSHDGTSLLVESAQSMANRMEEICLNPEKTDFVDALKGLTMIKVNDASGKQITNSVRESHRIGSYYILDGESDEIEKKLEHLHVDKMWHLEPHKTAPLLFEIDINSLLHGVWIAKQKIAGGRIKIPRVLSSFIEAKNVKSVISGGVKLDHIEPGKNEEAGGANKGQGNIPFSRIEYTAESITVFFNLDLAQIRSYGLGSAQTDLLINLALWKIQKFLDAGLRLRTACDLEIAGDPKITSPKGFTIPSISELESKISSLIKECKKQLPDSIAITYKVKKAKKDS